ncbi:hypothetical protein [Amycolatopsis sp. CA-128772]|uniref:hypothetical protein n=1 Tax=Amycolatopsis sp. CA-128772 TaxID=2073159 RepID=UPI0018EB0A48|nr:hypothetical protein [Amycolatopsis sp. CA-128772]
MKTTLLDPERQFLGCVMQVRLTAARRLLTGMRADDFGSPIAARVLQLIIELTGAGHAPTPMAVMDHARERTATEPRSGGAHRLHSLGLWIVETYTDGPILPLPYYGAWLKAVVLKNAYRRAVREHAARLVQAVEDDSPTDVLRHQLDDTERLDDLWRRYREAGGDDEPTARLEVAA